jgi:hypothetical protein
MEKLHKIVNGITIEFSDADYKEYEDNQARAETELFPALKSELLSKRKAYFATTDWYVSRKIKRGIEIPQEILKKEELCAKEIDSINACTTLQQLEEFKNNF